MANMKASMIGDKMSFADRRANNVIDRLPNMNNNVTSGLIRDLPFMIHPP